MLRTSRAEDQVITPVIKGWLDWGLEDSHTVNVPAHKCEHTLQYEDSRGQPRTAEDSGGQWGTVEDRRTHMVDHPQLLLVLLQEPRLLFIDGIPAAANQSERIEEGKKHLWNHDSESVS